tara:strand:+ start:264 stop:773 length:510 start_codon:yes stop_codon:yes gene_type:complete
MNKLVATSLSIGGVGGVMSLIYLSSYISAPLAIPVSFIAWGAFAAAGGNNKALTSTITALIYGAVVGWLTAQILMGAVAGFLPQPLANAVSVGLSVFVLIYGTKVKAFSAVPAAVYGYALFFALLLSGTADNLTGASLTGNPLVFTAAFGAAGAVFGMIANNVSASLGK